MYMEVPHVRAREVRRYDLLEEARAQRMVAQAAAHVSRARLTWMSRIAARARFSSPVTLLHWLQREGDMTACRPDAVTRGRRFLSIHGLW